MAKTRFSFEVHFLRKNPVLTDPFGRSFANQKIILISRMCEGRGQTVLIPSPPDIDPPA